MFYEVPNEMNDLAVRVHNNNIPGVMTIPQNVGPNMKTYIYCCSVCHPLYFTYMQSQPTNTWANCTLTWWDREAIKTLE